MLSHWHSHTMQALASRELPPGLVMWAPLTAPKSKLPTGQTPIWTGNGTTYETINGRRCCTMNGDTWFRVPVEGFSPGIAGAFTMSCWFLFRQNGRRAFISLGNYEVSGGAYAFYRNATASRTLFLTADCNFGNTSNNTWYHAVVTYNTDGTAKLYLGGALHATQTRTPVETNWTDVTVGNNTSETYTGVTGSIADVRIYNYEMTAEEVARLN